jgi:hypothetical protein
VDPVHEQVRVTAEAEQPLAKPVVMGLPLLAHAADRRRRQPRGVLTQQPFKRGAEVPGRETPEVNDRDHLPDLRRAARVRRQDPRAELLPLPGLLVEALVVHAWRADRDRARPDRDLAFPRAAVTDNEPVSALVQLLAEPLDVFATSARSAAAIIRLAPSRARPSSVSRISSLPSPTGSVRTFVIGLPSFLALRGDRS